MMTREDVLRELELLPVWQLRAPLKPLVVAVNPVTIKPVVALVVETDSVVTAEPIVEVTLEKSAYEKPLSISPELIPESILETVLEAIQAPLTELVIEEPISYQCIASDDNAYLFILAAEPLKVDAQTLLNNIWRAMRISTKSALSSTAAMLDLTQHQVIIAMGESVAQQLLARTDSLQALRGQPLTYQDKPLVATYDATHLLQHSADKPQAWADLLHGMRIVNDLKLIKAPSS